MSGDAYRPHSMREKILSGAKQGVLILRLVGQVMVEFLRVLSKGGKSDQSDYFWREPGAGVGVQRRASGETGHGMAGLAGAA